MFGKLNLVFPDLRNVQSVEALIFIEKTVKVKDLIAGEADKGTGAMEGIAIKAKGKTGFLFCPRCGLRRPKYEILGYYSGYCPSCGTRMIEEGSLPYISKSNLSKENNSKNKMREVNIMYRINSINSWSRKTK